MSEYIKKKPSKGPRAHNDLMKFYLFYAGQRPNKDSSELRYVQGWRHHVITSSRRNHATSSESDLYSVFLKQHFFNMSRFVAVGKKSTVYFRRFKKIH